MECVIQHGESPIKFKFSCKNTQQKILIDILLKYSTLNINNLTSLLNVSVEMIKDVYQDKRFFVADAADNLVILFLMFLSD